MPRTRKPKPTDVPETILDQFAGPARPMSQAEVESITKRFKKALAERMLGGELVIPFFAFRRRSVACSTRPMRSKACMRGFGKSSRRGGTSRTTRPPRS